MENQLPVQEVDELIALQRALQRTQGFALYVVRVNTSVLRQRISKWLAQNISRPIKNISLKPDKSIYEQIVRGAARTNPEAVLSIFGLETLAHVEEGHWLRRQLNWRRASFRKIQHPIVLWLPEHILPLVMESAPDFFDWHSGFFEFSLTDEQAQREYQKGMSAWDRPMLARTPAERAQMRH